MIYLTGDVHTSDNNNWEQKETGSELKSSKTYLEILKGYDIPCTLFVNGISFTKEPEEVKELLKYNVELGGHTYNNFGRLNLIKSYFYRKKWGCIYGSKSYQKKDIKKTKMAFEKFGLKMISWRTHAFGSNKETFKILKEFNVKYVSDLLGETKPFYDQIIHLPINIPVDQNTISYKILSPENRCPFASCTKGRISPEEWFEILKKRIIKNEKNKTDSIILIHPATMATLDNFKLFKEIAIFLSKYKCAKFSKFSLEQ